jgi:type IV pilus assembly protein PilA
MKKQQSGFTLIELMIVVAIIGILAAIAIPSYMDYTTKARVTEGLTLAAAAKTGVSEFRSSEGDWPTNNSSIGLPAADDIKGEAVKSVEVSAGKIEITYGPTVDEDKTIILSPVAEAGSITWSCDQGTLADNYRPANCR